MSEQARSISVSLTLPPESSRFGSPEKVYQKNVNYKEFKRILATYLFENRQNADYQHVYDEGNREKQFTEIANNFFLEFLPEANQHPLFERFFVENNQVNIEKLPFISITLTDRWAVAYIGSKANKISEFVFFFDLDMGGRFTEIKLPNKLKIDGYSSLTGIDESTGLDANVSFPFDRPPWPWPVLNPDKYWALGELNWLMESHDDNPLTGIIRSPQPVKTAGHQISKRLREIYTRLVKSMGH